MSDPNALPPRGLLNWWQGLILAASSALLGVIVTIVARSGGGPDAAPSWLILILRFVPHFLLMFGVLADAFTYEGVYWTGTAIGVAAIPVGSLLAKAFTQLARIPGLVLSKEGAAGGVRRMRGGEPPGLYPGCSLTGVETSNGVPETLVITASILSYYIFDLMFNLSVLDAVGAIVAGIVLFGGQAVAISSCMDSPGSQSVLAGLAGLMIGGAGYSIIGYAAPGYLPSNVIGGSVNGGAIGHGGAGPGRGGDPGSPALAKPNGAPGSANRCVR